MNGHIVINCQQGSDEWKMARAGVITASNFRIARSRKDGLNEQQQLYVTSIRTHGMSETEARIEAGYKAPPTSETVKAALRGETVGKPSDVALKLAFRLAIERISGMPLDDGVETYAMRRGHELEPQARLCHQRDIDQVVHTCGIILTEDRVFGCSADGLIGDDGGAEYKCLISPDSLMPVLLDGDITEFTDQVQGCLWLSGRKWWDFGLYCPALVSLGREFTRMRITRDEAYIEQLESDLLEFKGLVDSYERQLRRD